MEPLAQAQVSLNSHEFAVATLLTSLKAFRWVIAIWLGIGLLNLVLALLPRRETSPSLTSAIPMFAIVVVLIALIWFSALLRFRKLPIERRTYHWRFFASHIETESSLSTARLEWSL